MVFRQNCAAVGVCQNQWCGNRAEPNGTRHSSSQDWHKECLLHHSGTPSGQTSPRNELERCMAHFSDSTPCTKGRFIPKLRSALQAAGLVGPNFAGHSFCIGATTTAAECGIEDSTIKVLGRWHSSVFLAYLHMPREHLATISHTLSTLTPSREQV